MKHDSPIFDNLTEGLLRQVDNNGELEIQVDSTTYVPEAPIDGNQYARKDGDWEQVQENDVSSLAMPSTTGSQDYTITENVDYQFNQLTGDYTINLTGSHVPNKSIRFFIDGSGDSRSLTVIGARYIDGLFNDNTDRTNIITIEVNAEGVLFYFITSFEKILTPAEQPPEFVSAEKDTNVADDAILITFDEALDIALTPPSASTFLVEERISNVWTDKIATSVVLNYDSDPTKIRVNVSSDITGGNEVRVSYTKPLSNGLADPDGNRVESFTQENVINLVSGGFSVLIDDDLTDNSTNATIWDDVDGSNADIVEQNNRLEVSCTGITVINSCTYFLQNTYASGDFSSGILSVSAEVQMNSISGHFPSLVLGSSIGASNDASNNFVRFNNLSNSDTLRWQLWNGTTKEYEQASVSASGNFVRFKIEYNFNTNEIKVYYWNSSTPEWEQIGVTQTQDLGTNLIIGFLTNAGGSSSGTGYFRDFFLVDGEYLTELPQ